MAPLSRNVNVINKSKDYIGLATQSELASTTDGVLFVYNGSNDNEYLLESNFDQVTAKTQKITSTVAVSTSHGLLNGDSIEMVVEPNQTGVTTVKYNAENGKLLINPISFNNSSVRTNDLNLSKHNLKKVRRYSMTEMRLDYLQDLTMFIELMMM